MNADRLTEPAAGQPAEAVNADQWAAARRALDEVREAREKRAELEAEIEQAIESPIV